MGLLTDFLFKDKRKEASGIIDSIGDTCDKLFTSDEERKEMQVKLDRLQALNKSTFVAGGRSALMYAVGIVLVYQAVVRDWLAIVYGVEHLPKAAIDVQTMAMTLIKLFAGAL